VADLDRQRQVVGAFLAASRRGDFEGQLVLLDPHIVLRADATAASAARAVQIHDAQTVAKRALAFSRRAPFAQPALVTGAAGMVAPLGHLLVVTSFLVRNDKIT
jgi:RNA polymerase sigma-70 factor (ECF subfamily)